MPVQQQQSNEQKLRIVNEWLAKFKPARLLSTPYNGQQLVQYIYECFNDEVTITTLSQAVEALGDAANGGQLVYEKEVLPPTQDEIEAKANEKRLRERLADQNENRFNHATQKHEEGLHNEEMKAAIEVANKHAQAHA